MTALPTMPAPPTVIEQGLAAQDLTLGYHGTAVVHQATIDVPAGVVTALVGPNGSGKSTLLRAMARLHRPLSGDVRIDGGEDALALTPREFARRVTLLAQSRPCPTGLTVRDVVAFGRHPHRGRWGSRSADDQSAIDWASSVTGIEPLLTRTIDELSGGERQRVWLATCLAQEAGVLLLDEPTTYLDLRYQVEMLELIRDLADEHGVAVGVVLHDLNQAADVCDRVAVLQEGRIRVLGAPRDVLTADLLSEVWGLRIDVTTDPVTGSVRATPQGRHRRRRRS